MTVEIISRSISMKVWNGAGIKLATPGSAVGLATDCAMEPGAGVSDSFFNLQRIQMKPGTIHHKEFMFASRFCQDRLMHLAFCALPITQ